MSEGFLPNGYSEFRLQRYRDCSESKNWENFNFVRKCILLTSKVYNVFIPRISKTWTICQRFQVSPRNHKDSILAHHKLQNIVCGRSYIQGLKCLSNKKQPRFHNQINKNDYLHYVSAEQLQHDHDFELCQEHSKPFDFQSSIKSNRSVQIDNPNTGYFNTETPFICRWNPTNSRNLPINCPPSVYWGRKLQMFQMHNIQEVLDQYSVYFGS